jgi:maltose alpha-D-glucosyltransferase/alpha-amylase
MLNGRLVLGLARADAEPIVDALRDTPQLPEEAQWATFLRNHDEIDLSRLTAEQRNEVFAQFGPDENMQLYGRGIRRRLAPMLGNDRRHLELAYSLQFTLRGTPVLRYGDEIGMGEDLSLPDRNAIRTPMQWSAAPNGGFSTATPKELVRPVVSGGEFGYEQVNVEAAKRDEASLLRWFERMIRTLRECPEVGTGSCTAVDVALPRHVLAHRAESAAGSVLFVHNLGADDVRLDLSGAAGKGVEPAELFADQRYEPVDATLAEVPVAGHGYRWIRLRGH